ncbi:hypothetical protein [Klebsiella pneumoniae]|uniref:hypothetical protein n=1 Tax=Klebsiella pneumoniae TaxID=573 RepID=UPI003986CB81
MMKPPKIIYCPERLQLNFDWAGAIPGLFGAPSVPHWRTGSAVPAQVAQAANVSGNDDVVSPSQAEMRWPNCFLPSWRSDLTAIGSRADPVQAPTQDQAAPAAEPAAQAAGNIHHFVLERFCEQEGGRRLPLPRPPSRLTGMTINHYPRQPHSRSPWSQPPLTLLRN